MTRLRCAATLLATAATAGLTGCGAAGGSPAPATASPTGTIATLQSRLDVWRSGAGRQGVSAAVIWADGSVWTGTAGLARSGEALRPEHQIAMGSITKSVTAALVLQLAAEGRVALEDPVAAWLGGLDHVPPATTLRQLLNHTCGLANYTLHPSYGPTLAADASRRFTPLEVLTLFLEPPVFAPSARTQYTNTAYLLLGLIAEAAGRRPIAAVWRERFWGPLGLDEVFLPPDEGPRGAVANAWVGTSATGLRETAPLGDVAGFSSAWAAFGLVASPRAVARWGRALLAGSVLGAAMRQQMLQFVAPAGNIEVETGSGLGVRRYGYGGREQWGHSGAIAAGSSIFLFEPGSGITVAVAMNQSPASHASSHFALVGELLHVAAAR